MASSRASNIPVISLFIFLFIIRAIQGLFFASNTPQLLIVYVVGLIVMAFFMRSNNLGLRNIGLPFISQIMIRGFIIAFCTVAASVGVVIVCESLIFNHTINATSLINITTDIYNSTEAYSIASSGIKAFILWGLIGVVFCFIRSVFIESFFRGIFFEHFKTKLGFMKINLIQSALFVVWMSVSPIRNLITVPNMKKQIALSILLYAIVNFILAFRAGLICRATGAIWAAVIDYFIMNCFNTFIHITNHGNVLFDYYRVIAIQLVALAVYVGIYIFRWRKSLPR